MTGFLDVAAVTGAFPATGWHRLTVVPQTGSTNADLTAAARLGAPHGSVVMTPWQRAGRGRLDRVWETPADTCVAMSVLVRPTMPAAQWTWLPVLVGLAVREGVQAASGLEVGLKWPNDVLLAGKKLAGILCEAVETDAGRAAVLGMGINVALAEDQLPVPTATSLRLAGAHPPADAVATAVLTALWRWYQRWDAGDGLRDAYRDVCDTLGRPVRVIVAGGTIDGTAVDIAATGALLVQTPSGVQEFAAGDVIHLRPGE